tara:strand:+ start:1118 stop:2011 length:894 start_codon:yes stop_codon:yes gene_type:complete
MNLVDIKKNIIRFVESGENVDHVIDITTSNLNDNQKINLIEMFEVDMLKQINEASNLLNVRIQGSLNSILKSRLFVYPELDTTYQQDLYNEKLENDTYTAEDFHEQIFNHSKSPLTIKIEKWQNNTHNGIGGLMAVQTDLVQRRNQMIYSFSDKLAKCIHKNNIDVGIYINNLDEQIKKLSSDCDVLSVIHLREISHSKNILIWNAFTTEKNLQVSSEEGFGTYKISCKLQWDVSNNQIQPCAGSVQLDECENLSVFPKKYFPVFIESFDDVNDLETNIKLLYNKLHELREDPKISC